MTHCLRCNQELPPDQAHYGQHLHCFQQIFGVSGRPEFESLMSKGSTSGGVPQSEEAQISPHLTSYFGGNYRKYEGTLGASKYILKLSKPEYPELAPVEYVSNKIAYYCGLSLPVPFALIDMGDRELAFVSRNFMSRFAQHATLNHIYHFGLLDNPDRYNVENIAQTIFRETKSVIDTHMFYRMLLFDALIGNHDRHGRNLAFIATAGKQRLSPIYDNPSYLGLESGTMLKQSLSPRGKIWTRLSQEPMMTEYLEELSRLNCINIAKDFYKSLPIKKIVQSIEESVSLSPSMKKALKKLIGERYNDLEVYLGN